ncbi:MAG: hypothetical protein JNK05_25230 [Myxococcales bacterium]|nr:hypothetical protein [Myxococcales bacterium]
MMLRRVLAVLFVSACAHSSVPSTSAPPLAPSPPRRAEERPLDGSNTADAATTMDASSALAASYASDELVIEARWIVEASDGGSRAALSIVARPGRERILNAEAPISMAIDTADLTSFDAGARGRGMSPGATVHRRQDARAFSAQEARFVVPLGAARPPLRLVVNMVVDTADQCLVLRPTLPLASPP